MAKIILDLGFLKVSASFLQRRPSGLFYYYRRIPKDLLGHYGKKQFRRESLKTTDERAAIKRVAALAARDDALWAALRTHAAQDMGLTTPEAREGARALMAQWGLSEGEGHRTGPDAQSQISNVADVMIDYFTGRYGSDYERARNDPWFASHIRSPESFYNPVEAEAVRLVMSDPSKRRVLLSDALKHYLENRTKTPTPKFIRDNTAYIAKVTEAVGDLPLTEYRREHVHRVKDRLLASGITTGTARRTLNAISAIFNHGRREFDLTGIGNPFEGVQIAAEGEDAEDRPPFTLDELATIEAACRSRDDDIRHIIAMQADTGSRNGEIVGLRIEDVFLDAPVPYLHIREYPALGRTLKNENSTRKVPLVGIALWATERAVKAHGEQKQGWLFPRYAQDNDIKATHASNTINKWIRKVPKIDKTTHSFRHTMRDRLRAVEAPEEIQDAIGGWKSQGSIGRSYGEGHALVQLKDWLLKAVEHGKKTKGAN